MQKCRDVANPIRDPGAAPLALCCCSRGQPPNFTSLIPLAHSEVNKGGRFLLNQIFFIGPSRAVSRLLRLAAALQGPNQAVISWVTIALTSLMIHYGIEPRALGMLFY